jgi:hypothetical protein
VSFTISAGWWLLPLAITIGAFGWAALICRPSSSPSYADGIVSALVHGAATIVSLIAWLIFSLLN